MQKGNIFLIAQTHYNLTANLRNRKKFVRQRSKIFPIEITT